MTTNDEAVYDRVVELYQSGMRLKDITTETGVPRPTIYWVLQKRGLRPSRTKAVVEEINSGQILEQLAAANREIGRLSALLEQREQELTRLKARKRSTK